MMTGLPVKSTLLPCAPRHNANFPDPIYVFELSLEIVDIHTQSWISYVFRGCFRSPL